MAKKHEKQAEPPSQEQATLEKEVLASRGRLEDVFNFWGAYCLTADVLI